MIVDISAFAGNWSSLLAPGDAETVHKSLKAVGVDLIMLSALDAAWAPSPHRANKIAYEGAGTFRDVYPVPVLDPTCAGWRRELERAAAHQRVRAVRLMPTYRAYELDAADELLAAIADAGLAAIVQTRMEDPRSHHPLAQVPDLDAKAVVAAAERHPDLTVVICGPRRWDLVEVVEKLRSLPNLFADVSQMDGMNAIKGYVEDGLAEKLMFGSHAPLFVAWSAMARVVTDLDDAAAEAILGGNAARVLGLP